MANLYDLKKFDLNLLVIFECIYQHLSISKAAETLYITLQPSVSLCNACVASLTIRCLSVPARGSPHDRRD